MHFCSAFFTFNMARIMCLYVCRQRDEVQMAAKSRLFPPTDMTTALVSLNRCMYAQLMQVRAAVNFCYRFCIMVQA